MRNNEQGRSMIEMLGVLAIVGVLSVGGIAGYSKAMNKFKQNKVMDQINMISTNVRTLFASQKDYNGLNTTIAVNAGLIPGEMYDPNDSASVVTVKDAFDGEVVLGPATGDTANDSYYVAFEGIPASACATFVTTDWGGEIGSGLAAVQAMPNDGDGVTQIEGLGGDTAIAVPTAGTDNGAVGIPGDESYPIPFTVTMMGAGCPKSGTATIVWYYK